MAGGRGRDAPTPCGAADSVHDALGDTVVHLDAKGTATAIACDADSWEAMPACFEQGRMVSVIRSDADWPNWEMHPAGEELICLLSGAMTLILEQDGVPAGSVHLEAGRSVLVGRGVWHTADVAVAGEALYVTPGAGTRNRPRTPARDGGG